MPSQAPRGPPSSGIPGPSGSSERFALQLDAEFSTLSNDFSAGCFSRGKRDVRGKGKGERKTGASESTGGPLKALCMGGNKCSWHSWGPQVLLRVNLSVGEMPRRKGKCRADLDLMSGCTGRHLAAARRAALSPHLQHRSFMARNRSKLLREASVGLKNGESGCALLSTLLQVHLLVRSPRGVLMEVGNGGLGARHVPPYAAPCS